MRIPYTKLELQGFEVEHDTGLGVIEIHLGRASDGFNFSAVGERIAEKFNLSDRQTDELIEDLVNSVETKVILNYIK